MAEAIAEFLSQPQPRHLQVLESKYCLTTILIEVISLDHRAHGKVDRYNTHFIRTAYLVTDFLNHVTIIHD